MIFLILDSKDLKTVLRFPLTSADVRYTLNTTSLPAKLSASILPEYIVEVKDTNLQSLDASNISILQNLTPYLNNNNEWVVELPSLNDIVNETLEEVKVKKLNELLNVVNNQLSLAINSIHIPDFEIQSWVLQAQEITLWNNDKTLSTPLLENIAINREIDLDILREKTLQKTLQYQQVTSFLIGKRQMYETIIANSNSIEDLHALKFNISLPLNTNEEPQL